MINYVKNSCTLEVGSKTTIMPHPLLSNSVTRAQNKYYNLQKILLRQYLYVVTHDLLFIIFYTVN